MISWNLGSLGTLPKTETHAKFKKWIGKISPNNIFLLSRSTETNTIVFRICCLVSNIKKDWRNILMFFPEFWRFPKTKIIFKYSFQRQQFIYTMTVFPAYITGQCKYCIFKCSNDLITTWKWINHLYKRNFPNGLKFVPYSFFIKKGNQ